MSVGLIMTRTHLDRRPKKKNKERSLRFLRSNDPRRIRKDWNNSLIWKRSRQLRQKGERA